ncbi:allantoinase AllB [Myceligenerans xiligouense]|uniref:allantoinase n=1 Tax=Myceligenerans xiligouense TaxID=253184 RepID=A0A3N4ZL28_9MICO|nr:allantoinase AllB [Myceligenerans xiligouense]RPF20631.1 allantoinase [Myceligenerans xiligouense]
MTGSGDRTVTADQVMIDGRLRAATIRVEAGRIADVVVHGAGDTVPPVTVPSPAVVLPGVVDTHVHVNEPGRTSWEGFASASRAAALGGVTTIVDMPLNSLPPTTSVGALEVKRDAARAVADAGELSCDVAFWGGAVPGNVSGLEPLWDAGVVGFKCFLADSGVPEFPPLDPGELRAAMAEVARFGGRMVVHAEDPGVLAAAARPPSSAYADFLLSRPDDAETTAVARLLDVVRETGTRTHVLHVSSARVLDLLARAKGEGLPVTAETCHHYLTLAGEDVPDGDPAYKCCPPIRDRANQDALWDGLRDGLLDIVVSDHSPATADQKYGAKPVGEVDLQRAWGGVSGLQAGWTALAAAAREREVPLADVVRWTAERPARLAGLGRAKGRIAVGQDADLMVYDPDGTTTFRAAGMAHKNPISAYDRMTVTGRVVRVLRHSAPGRLITREETA